MACAGPWPRGEIWLCFGLRPDRGLSAAGPAGAGSTETGAADTAPAEAEPGCAGAAGAGWASATGPALAPAPGSRAAAAVTFWPSVIALPPCADTSTRLLSHRSPWFPLAPRAVAHVTIIPRQIRPSVTDIAGSLVVTTVLPRSRVTYSGHYVPTGQSTHCDRGKRSFSNRVPPPRACPTCSTTTGKVGMSGTAGRAGTGSSDPKACGVHVRPPTGGWLWTVKQEATEVPRTWYGLSPWRFRRGARQTVEAPCAVLATSAEDAAGPPGAHERPGPCHPARVML